MLKLSILDQTPIPLGSSAQEELENTTKLAQIAERLGYHRFWVSEHHLETLGHSSPEILIPHIASHTSTIRVGSGGVMLPHYSAYKVAENFRLLEALYPGRIDLGVGRAPGGIPLATNALQEHKHTYHDTYEEQIKDLIYYLTGSQDPNHRFRGLKAMPDIDTKPTIWVLGSSGGSAGLASSNGISYAFAHFISGQHGGSVVSRYKQSFQPSEMQRTPASMIAFFLVCAETDEEAEQLATSIDVQFLQVAKGEKSDGILSPEQAIKYPFTPTDHQIVRENRNKMLVGSPETVKAKLETLSEEYNTDEFMLASIMHDFHAKVKSYQLLAKAFGLKD
ncbi:LLM class flavin-dependent oxidoreductase [Aquibacillus koreensis]|uniref:LLM class flavin-dependent oxidoreductase n=1 Tax=Aquibacillus koreensis TaxID=279446 RepID=A0A9X3WIZ7_9BACI|nr:LLM class flavin-dependent oxidoreductase [Aquibacillus koreensis]MCT2538159.1 LLM class flavin-dependent oxidoreductase [Aquibacillus koreensis]MDC3420897.1 LLM class flavin-dependent oxidoreductase [Aquibacillus koreensis]